MRRFLILVCLVVVTAPGYAAQLKGVQSGTVVLSGGSSLVTDTLSPSVDLSKSFLVFGISGTDNSPDDMQVSGQITNTSTVTFSRFGTSGAVTIHWYVAEFLSGVTVQRGTVQLPGAANPADTNVPLSPVQSAHSFPVVTMRTNGATFDGGDFVRAKLTSNTNLLLAAPDADTNTFVEWQVVEYIGANVQTGDVSFGSTDFSRPATLSPAVDPAKSWLIYSYTNVTGSPNIGRALIRGVVTDPTTLTFDRNNDGDGLNLSWYLVEFTDQTTVQHASRAFGTGSLQEDVLLPTPINPGATLAAGGYECRGGRSSYAADDDPGVGWFTFDLTDSTNLRITRGTTAGTTATADAGWFVVDFLATGCAPLDVAETASTVAVTASADFRLVFDTAAGGSIEEFYDIAEDPGETNDLVGALSGSGSSEGLHNGGMNVGGVFYNAGENANGRIALLESTPARVRVRQIAPYDEGAAVLTGVYGQGDYSVYPSGKIGLRWTRRTTAPVTYTTEYVETFVHKTSSGPLSTWTSSSQTSGTSPGAGDDDFLLSVNENAGPEPARTDFLHVLHRDWVTAEGYGESADKTNWFYQSSSERENPGWIEETGQALPADDVESWDLLTYFRPRTLVDRFDTAVIERSEDYRQPGSLSITRGSPWNDPDQNTASDHFNEAEAAYLLTFDQANGLEFSMVLGATPRFAPFFKVRGWRSLSERPVVRLDGVDLTPGGDYQAAVKPLARAYSAKDVLLHNTFDSQTAVETSPDIGSAGTVTGTGIFQPGRYGNGALFDATGEVITFPSAGNIDFAQGAVELWFRPSTDHDDGVEHRLWTYRFDDDHQIFLRKTALDQLQMQIRTGPSATPDWVVTNVASADFSWKAGDWVHIRAAWNDAAAIGDEARIFVNGVEPAHSSSANDYDSANMVGGGAIGIGTDSNGNNPALGVIDEFRIYSTATPPEAIAHAGLTSDARESLASSASNFVLDLSAVDAESRGEYLYFGADSEFSGMNVQLATLGEGSAVVDWEFWNGNAWESLGGYGLTDGTASFTQHGSIFWTSDPFNWSVYSIDGGPELFFVRAHVSSGNYTTAPMERLVKTDLLLFQYCSDITSGGRVFAFDVPVATAVDLVSFDASGVADGIELRWRTGAELSNLGFHLYRSTSMDGARTRITKSLIPGLGSSPAGAAYVHLDASAAPGVTYFYWLEDVETTGKTERHGPVSAVFVESADEDGDGNGSDGDDFGTTRIAYGYPEANRVVVRRSSRDRLTVELWTEGFYAEPNEDGSLRLEVPGLDELEGSGIALPVKRMWLDALEGKRTRLGPLRKSGVEVFSSLRLAEGSEPRILADRRGLVRGERRRGERAHRGSSLVPSESARLVTEAFQGDDKRALLELAPIRYDGRDGSLWLARYLAVDVAFAGLDRAETRRSRAPFSGSRRAAGTSAGRLVTRERGLYAVSLPRRGNASARLTRLGMDVPYAIQEGRLYFWSEGAGANPYGDEAVFELEFGVSGSTMARVSAKPAPGSRTVSRFWHTERREENRMYQPTLLDAPDRWFWAMILSGATEAFELETRNLETSFGGRLSLRLHGGSDQPYVNDHHVRVLLNGVVLDETVWNGKRARHVDVAIPPGTLVEGTNRLEIENVGNAGAAYSLVFLDRFEVRYARAAVLDQRYLEGEWDADADVSVERRLRWVSIVDVTDANEPRWLEGFETDANGVRFRSEPGRRYVVAGEPLTPEWRVPSRAALATDRGGAELVVIGPRAYLDVAGPLMAHRRNQGLTVLPVDVAEVFDVFGHGERRPGALRDFLAFAYHEWQVSPRYVLLLGDASYDFKNYLGAPARNDVPSPLVRTSFLETASDPSLAAVNGDDPLPDLAIGRLPAGDEAELSRMVEKILQYESGGAAAVAAPLVLVTDNADAAGNFRADAESLARGVLAPHDNKALHLDELGASAMRPAIVAALDEGARLMSYMGHGGIHLWADESIFDTKAIETLSPQSVQPLLLTMNCLNGYFHFPYFDSLAEAMVTAQSKGAIAAFSPSGLSLNGPAHAYHRALLEAILNGHHERLGDAVLEAQSVFLSHDAFPELLTIYHLFGDPALVITPMR